MTEEMHAPDPPESPDVPAAPERILDDGPARLPAPDPSAPFVEQLFTAGAHFGHRAARWNPKMAKYIFAKKNKNHLIDIRETIRGVLRAEFLLERIAERGGDVLAVGTKRQAAEVVNLYSGAAEMHSVTVRWLGGTLTNFDTIRKRLKRLEELEAYEASGGMLRHKKKMQMRMRREMAKIERNLGGIRKMEKAPAVMIVIGANRETIALQEAAALGIPTIAIIDTDSDPDLVDICIPANDDAFRSIELIFKRLADAAQRGRELWKQSAIAREKARTDAARADKERARKAAAAQKAAQTGGGAPPSPAVPAVPATAPKRAVRRVVIPTGEDAASESGQVGAASVGGTPDEVAPSAPAPVEPAPTAVAPEAPASDAPATT